jgi:transcription elongation factor GreB
MHLMGRWKPAQPPSTALITSEGHARLKAELDELWKLRRPEVVRALSAAAAEGDRSENAEYIYRKKQLAEIDRRVRYLGKRLEVLRVAEARPTDRRAIYFGARIAIEDDAGDVRNLRIVGPDEIDPKLGYISIDSPLARACLGKRVDDEFEVELPAGRASFVVVEVRYD